MNWKVKTMLKLETTVQFRRDYKRMMKRGCKRELIEKVIETLLEEKPLDIKHRDHELKGDYAGFRECHIQPDWLLVYKVDKGKLILTASRTGTHADLF